MSDFHMGVCVKAVPGSTEVKMDPKTNTIVRDGKQVIYSLADDRVQALLAQGLSYIDE